MQDLGFFLLWIFGLVVLTEALNKLERTRPCVRGITRRQRFLAWLKALAWCLLALAGAGALIAPIFDFPPPTARELCMFAGFVVLIVRTRFKEG